MAFTILYPKDSIKGYNTFTVKTILILKICFIFCGPKKLTTQFDFLFSFVHVYVNQSGTKKNKNLTSLNIFKPRKNFNHNKLLYMVYNSTVLVSSANSLGGMRISNFSHMKTWGL